MLTPFLAFALAFRLEEALGSDAVLSLSPVDLLQLRFCETAYVLSQLLLDLFVGRVSFE